MAVKTDYGPVEGVKMDGYTVYKGIPFAKPPVGDLRWKAPQEPERWEGTLQADTFPAKCIQDPANFGPYPKEFYDYPEYQRPDSEDCLYLNVWAPDGAENLPVAFYIHGGGYGGGYGSEIEFDGEAYCEKGVILVTIQYRCHVLGFLTHPWLREEADYVSGNFGCLDQIAALKWVYENIGAFGGDPENITAFGQSAGCSSVETLISTKLTGSQVKKAILQSGAGYPTGIPANSPEVAEEAGRTFVELTGAKNMEELRALTAEQVQEYRHKLDDIMFPKIKELYLKPYVDGYVLEHNYDELTENGEVRDIPYMIGSVEDDLFVTPEMLAKGEKGSLYEGCIGWSKQMEALGREPSYVYYFKRHLPGSEDGAFHSAELWYNFGTLGRCWRPMEEHDFALSREMMAYWTNFIKQGDPNGEDLPEWPSCTKEHPYVKVFE